MRELSEKIKKESQEFRREVREKTFSYIIASLGLVVGLAWNEAIKAFIESFFPLEQDTLKAKFVYALAITVVVVFISFYFSKFFLKEKSEKEKKSS